MNDIFINGCVKLLSRRVCRLCCRRLTVCFGQRSGQNNRWRSCCTSCEVIVDAVCCGKSSSRGFCRAGGGGADGSDGRMVEVTLVRGQRF